MARCAVSLSLEQQGGSPGDERVLRSLGVLWKEERDHEGAVG